MQHTRVQSYTNKLVKKIIFADSILGVKKYKDNKLAKFEKSARRLLGAVISLIVWIELQGQLAAFGHVAGLSDD